MKTYKTLKNLRRQFETLDTAHHDPGFRYGQEKMKDTMLELLDAAIETEVQILVRQDAFQSGAEELNEPILDDDYPIHAGYVYVMDGVPKMADFPGTVAYLKRILKVKEIRRFDMFGREEQKQKREKVNGLLEKGD